MNVYFLTDLKHTHTGINSHWEVLEATRPIGIVHVRDRMNNSTSTVDAQGKPAAAKTLFEAILTNTTYYRPSAMDQCKHNMTVSLYLPQRFHSNPPTTGIGAVIYYLFIV